jgi:hypothetical protein
VLEVTATLALAAFVGWLRPRWSTLWVTLVPTTLAFAWLLLQEDIPGDETTAVDIAWFVAMSLVVGLACAVACAAGIVARGSVSAGRRIG